MIYTFKIIISVLWVMLTLGILTADGSIVPKLLLMIMVLGTLFLLFI